MNNEQFDAEWYLACYPDVALSGINPLKHYLRFGMHFGRSPNRNCQSSINKSKNILSSDFSIPSPECLESSVLANNLFVDTSTKSTEPLYAYIDAPRKGDFVGHDYIEVAGWCYLWGEETASVKAEILGGGKSVFLSTGISRVDVSEVIPGLKFYNVGFEGAVYPSIKKGKEPVLLVVAESSSGLIHEMRVDLKVNMFFKGLPQNCNMATSELAQNFNGERIF
jgi:hypothetical protein